MVRYALLVSLLLPSLARAEEFYLAAKSAYSQLRAKAEADIADLDRQRAEAYAPYDLRMKQLQADRENCQTFDCAKQLDAEIKKVFNEGTAVANEFVKKQHVVRTEAAQK